MKAFEVIVEESARADAEETVAYIAGFSADRADQWAIGLEDAIASLATMPARCPRARESATIGSDLRQLLYGSYRVVFRIEEDAGVVRVLYVRHAARRTVGEPEKPDDD